MSEEAIGAAIAAAPMRSEQLMNWRRVLSLSIRGSGLPRRRVVCGGHENRGDSICGESERSAGFLLGCLPRRDPIFVLSKCSKGGCGRIPIFVGEDINQG